MLVLIVAAVLGSASGTDAIRFKAPEVLVSDSDGVPLFRGRRDFVLKIARNPAGEVVAYDERTRRVRVSKVGTELWLSCADLEPMSTSCTPSARRNVRSGALRGAGEATVEQAAAGVPSCPGDRRCPRIPD